MDSDIKNDAMLLKKLSELHRSSPIDLLVLNHVNKLPALLRYCEQQDIDMLGLKGEDVHDDFTTIYGYFQSNPETDRCFHVTDRDDWSRIFFSYYQTYGYDVSHTTFF